MSFAYNILWITLGAAAMAIGRSYRADGHRFTGFAVMAVGGLTIFVGIVF